MNNDNNADCTSKTDVLWNNFVYKQDEMNHRVYNIHHQFLSVPRTAFHIHYPIHWPGETACTYNFIYGYDIIVLSQKLVLFTMNFCFMGHYVRICHCCLCRVFHQNSLHGYEFRIPKFTLELVKYIPESIRSDAFTHFISSSRNFNISYSTWNHATSIKVILSKMPLANLKDLILVWLESVM